MTSSANRAIYRRPPIRGAAPGYYTNNMRQMNRGLAENNRSNGFYPEAAKKSMAKSFLSTFKSFCRQSTLHGFKNIIENFTEFKTATTRHQKITKLISVMFWALACILGTGFALTLMYLVWLRYDTTPTITTVETTNYPIWNVPFPAVTICNVNKVYRPAAENITAILMERGLDEKRIMNFLSNLDKLITPDYVNSLFYRFFEILQTLNYTSERLMFELMEPCTFMIQKCVWLGKSVPCQTLFRVAKSSEGFCCSFNYKALKNSLEVDSDEDVVSDQLDDPVYRVSGAGINVGLSAIIRIAPTDYVAYSKSFYGAYFLIHGPEDYPQASVTTVVGQPGCDLAIAVTPSVVVSEPSIRKLPQSKRKCLFDDEKKLRTSQKYSYQTCITECSVDTIIERCRCLPFFFPEINLKWFSKKIRQCTLMDARCLRENQHIFYSLKPKDDIDDGAGNKNADLGMTCDQCLPSCSEENYSVETNLARRYPEDKLISNNHITSANLSYYLTFKIYFKDIVCIKYRRDVFQTWDGLLAGFGGIFGLCLGGSVISLVEMIYFFTIRWYSDYVGRNGSNNQQTATKLNQIQSFEQLKFNSKLKNQIMVNARTIRVINQSIVKAGHQNPSNVRHGLRSIGYGDTSNPNQYY